MNRPTSLLLLGAASLAILVPFVFHDDPSPAATTPSMEQRKTDYMMITTVAAPLDAPSIRTPLAYDPGSITPILDPNATLDASNSTDIGEPQSVDEPAWWDAPPEAIELGETLDADDPTAQWNASTELVEIGEPLDADEPTAWAAQQSPPVPREIGEPLDADAPWSEQPQARRSPVDIGAPLDATSSDLNPFLNDGENARREQ